MSVMTSHIANLCRDILMQAPMMVLLLAGREGRVELFNQEFERLFGHRELAGRTMRQAWPELEGHDFFEVIERVYDSGQPEQLREYLAFVHREDGRLAPRWFDFHYQAYHDDSSQTAGVVMYGMDVTDRVEAQKELQTSEERLAFAQEAGGIGTFEWVVGSDRVLWMPELERQYGLEPGTFEGNYEGWTKRVHPEDVDLAGRMVRRTVETSEPMQLEYRIIWPDGSIRWLLARAKPLMDGEGKPHKLIGMSIDITERKQLEDRLKEANDRITKILEEVLDGAA
jgi:PAS domain S-box-containing protein